MRVFQPRQNVTLSCEPLREVAAQPTHYRQLQRYIARERAVGTLGQPHIGHAASTQFTLQPIRSNASAGGKRCWA